MVSKNEQSRTPDSLSESCEQRLSPALCKRLMAYATVAATSAACPPLGNAEIVYTPVHSDINFTYDLDLNHDGINDFKITSFYSSYSNNASLGVEGLVHGNKFVIEKPPCYISPGVAALPAGVVIGPNLKFGGGTYLSCMAILLSNVYNGPWLGAKERYLGLTFFVEGKRHYGWARLSVDNLFCYKCIARIQGYAYETVPDRPIIAGDEGNKSASVSAVDLGTLALGAAGIPLWRREEPALIRLM